MLRTAFLGFLALAACGSSAESSSASSAAATTTSSPNHELVPYVDESIIQARFADFQARNAGPWKMDAPTKREVIPAIERRLSRDVPWNVTPVTVDRDAVVRAFVAKNADLLGIDDAPSVFIAWDVEDGFEVASSTPDSPYVLGLDTRYDYYVVVAADGEVSEVRARSRRYPALTMDPTASVPPSLVGTSLTFHQHAQTTVSADDIQYAYANATETETVAGVQLDKVVGVNVNRNGVHICPVPFLQWALTIDPDTNTLVSGTDTECISW